MSNDAGAAPASAAGGDGGDGGGDLGDGGVAGYEAAGGGGSNGPEDPGLSDTFNTAAQAPTGSGDTRQVEDQAGGSDDADVDQEANQRDGKGGELDRYESEHSAAKDIDPMEPGSEKALAADRGSAAVGEGRQAVPDKERSPTLPGDAEITEENYDEHAAYRDYPDLPGNDRGTPEAPTKSNDGKEGDETDRDGRGGGERRDGSGPESSAGSNTPMPTTPTRPRSRSLKL
jgi:hypothetical protein